MELKERVRKENEYEAVEGKKQGMKIVLKGITERSHG